MYDDMSYKKCIECRHSLQQYFAPGGMDLICRLTGKSIRINHCRAQYGGME